jgi:hypothetical protein
MLQNEPDLSNQTDEQLIHYIQTRINQSFYYKYLDGFVKREQKFSTASKSVNDIQQDLADEHTNQLFQILVLKIQNNTAKLIQFALDNEQLLLFIYQFAIHCKKSPLNCVDTENSRSEREKKTIENWKNWTRILITHCQNNAYSSNEAQITVTRNLIKAAGKGNEKNGIQILKRDSKQLKGDELCLVNPPMAILSLELDRPYLNKNKKLFTDILNKEYNKENLAVHLPYVRDKNLLRYATNNSFTTLAKGTISQKKNILRQYLKTNEAEKNLGTILHAQETSDWRYLPLPCDSKNEFIKLIKLSNDGKNAEKLFVQVLKQKVQPSLLKQVFNVLSGADNTKFNKNDADFINSVIKNMFVPSQVQNLDKDAQAIQTFVKNLLQKEGGAPAAAQLILDKIGNELDFDGLVELAILDKSGTVFKKVFDIGFWNEVRPSIPQQKIMSALSEAIGSSNKTTSFRQSFSKIALAHANNDEILRRIYKPQGKFGGVDYSFARCILTTATPPPENAKIFNYINIKKITEENKVVKNITNEELNTNSENKNIIITEEKKIVENNSNETLNTNAVNKDIVLNTENNSEKNIFNYKVVPTPPGSPNTPGGDNTSNSFFKNNKENTNNDASNSIINNNIKMPIGYGESTLIPQLEC